MLNKVHIHHRQQGFSLIEVLISFLLIGIGALGLVKLQVYIEQRAGYAVQSVEALHLAEKKLEWFRTRGASSTSSALSTVADFNTSLVNGNEIHGEYTISWSVPTATVSGSLKTITLDAIWQDRLNNDHNVRLQTMISSHSEFD